MRINLEGDTNIEMRICLSLITSQPIEINNIATRDGGLKSYQISLLQLLSKITNGASYDINETGCRLRIIPGTLLGGEIEHECDNKAALGYYVQYLILLSPFCQKPVEAVLNGVTNKDNSISIELINYGLKDFIKEMVGEASIFNLDVVKRGAYPNGGGMAKFTARPVQSLKPLNRTKVGKVQKLRGLAWTTRLNPTIGKRIIDGAKKNFRNLLSDFYIRLDHSSKDKSGNSPGYGVILVSTTTEGAAYTVDVTCKSNEDYDGEPTVPEDLGHVAVEVMKKAIVRGGVVSSDLEPILLTMMALGRNNVSKIVLGVPNSDTRQVLRDLETFTGVRFNLVPLRAGMDGFREKSEQELVLTCMGCGLVNLNRAIR